MNKLLNHFTLQPYDWRSFDPVAPLTTSFVDGAVAYRETRYNAHYDTRIMLGCSFRVPANAGIEALSEAVTASVQNTLNMIYGETYSELAHLQRQLMMGLDKRVAANVIADIMRKICPVVQNGDLIVTNGHIKVNHERLKD